MTQAQRGWGPDGEGSLKVDDDDVLDLSDGFGIGLVQFDRDLAPRHHNRAFEALTGTRTIRGLLSESEDAAAALAGAALAVIDGDEAAPVRTQLVNGRCVEVTFSPLAEHEALAQVRELTDEVARRAHVPIAGEGARCIERWQLRDALAADSAESLGVGAIVAAIDDLDDTVGGRSRDDVDQLLDIVGERICGASRRSDHVVRLGVHEWAVVAPSVVSRHIVESVADRLRDAVDRPIFLGGRGLQVRSTVVHRWAAPGEAALKVLDEADHALYEARRRS